MSRIPDANQTPQGPAYEGRLLARPDDEVVDQGAGFDVKTLVTRRRVLGLVGAGVGAATLAACSWGDTATSSTGSASGSAAAATTSDGEIPEETNGPYPADGTNDLNVLEESGIVRSDITSSLEGGTTVEGVPFELTFAVTDMANNTPFKDAAVYAWQCDAQGLYSMYSQGVEDETYLRGIQVADAHGELTFKTIVPGCYTGRWTHIHFEVYPDVDSAKDVANVVATSQLAFPPDMLADVYALDAYSGSTKNLAGVGTAISDDGLFAEGDWKLQVPTITGDVKSGYTGKLAVGVDTTTAVTRGGDGGGSGGGQPPGGGGQPPGGGAPPFGQARRPARRLPAPAADPLDTSTHTSQEKLMLQNLSGWHALIVLAIILLVFGASKLPALAKSVGQSVRILKDEVHDSSDAPRPAVAVAAAPAPGPTAARASVPAADPTGVKTAGSPS